jgi:hypothetical protein
MTIYSKTNPPTGFYVYLYLRKDLTPYYVGKGKDIRAWTKMKRETQPPKDTSRIVISEANLTEVGALAIERRLIRWYGRKDLGTGILRNKTDGGEGASGAVRSEETRRKMGQAKIGNQHSKGVKRSPEQCRAIGDRCRGKPHSLEQNLNHSKTMKGRTHSVEHREAKSKAFKQLIWITDNMSNKRIPKTSEIPIGWIRGRTKVKCLPQP